MDSFFSNRQTTGAGAASPAGGLDSLGLQSGVLDGTEGFGGGVSHSGGFQSLRSALLEAGSVVDPSQPVVRINAGKAADHVHSHPGAEPSIELVKQDGRIEKIIVTCACGSKTELECTY